MDGASFERATHNDAQKTKPQVLIGMSEAFGPTVVWQKLLAGESEWWNYFGERGTGVAALAAALSALLDSKRDSQNGANRQMRACSTGR